MNKKLITLFTGLSLSALTVGALSIYHQNKSGFVKARANDKDYTVTSITGVEFDSEDKYYYGAGNIQTGDGKYIHADVEWDCCEYDIEHDICHMTEGGAGYSGYGAYFKIQLDIRGVTSFKINGSSTTEVNEYDDNKPLFYMVVSTYLFNTDGHSVGDFPIDTFMSSADEHDFTFGAVFDEIDTSDFWSESIVFRFENFVTLDITSIELTYSCAINE